jgi:NADP-dependent 3-hydroxy acid dehydrogenase YdfG
MMGRPKIVLITGASSGIGAAIARAFTDTDARVFLVGRTPRHLAAAVRRIPARRLAGVARLDLGSVADLNSLVATVSRKVSRLDALIHSASEYSWTELANPDTIDFDRMFEVNVRASYLLILRPLPLLERAKGQVIALNSSIVSRQAPARLSGFKATQHAHMGLVDSLRADLNQHGIRVSSAFPGRTATPRMPRIYAEEGERHTPRALMSAQDVAQLVLSMAALPDRMEVTDVLVRSATPY